MEAEIIKKHGLALAASDSDGNNKAIVIPSILVSVSYNSPVIPGSVWTSQRSPS